MSSGLCSTAATPLVGENFDQVVLPHLDAARRLARWLMGNEQDADDVVQEASLRALLYFRTFAGGNGRAWFLRIVRNTCYGWRGHRLEARSDPFDEEQHTSERPGFDPEAFLLHTDNVRLIDRALRTLPDRFRALLVGRELHGLTYRELADSMGIPIGTVMSSLSRARHAMRLALAEQQNSPAFRRPRRPQPETDAAPAAPCAR
jgi:RNA polymerase sigma-70 factor, ECF subfamily